MSLESFLENLRALTFPTSYPPQRMRLQGRTPPELCSTNPCSRTRTGTSVHRNSQINIFGFAGHSVSEAAFQLCPECVRGAQKRCRWVSQAGCQWNSMTGRWCAHCTDFSRVGKYSPLGHPGQYRRVHVLLGMCPDLGAGLDLAQWPKLSHA